MQAKDTDADDICQHILSKGNIYLGALTDFGMTQTNLDSLQEAINQFTAAINQPQAAILQAKSANAQISELFTTNDKILSDQLDNLMYRFKTSHPAFYQEYTSAHYLGGQGSRSKKATREARKEVKQPA